jgi:drug/metabolite transporter (DMT)-like permease
MIKPLSLFNSANRPALRGGAWALLAATFFGLSTPLVQRYGQTVGAFSTAALLYAGAAFLALWMRQPVESEAKLTRSDASKIIGMALFGAVIGPAALAWGLQRTSGTSASLMLTLEALFTVVLAWRLYGESMDRRVATAMLLLLIGGLALVIDQGMTGNAQLVGLLAVLVATAAWGLDNTLSRGVADRDPAQVVIAKSSLGACASVVLALMFSERMPSAQAALALFAIGAIGYGLSLRFYLLAQRAFGAARTGSVYAFAPFIGAIGAFAFGDRSMGWIMPTAGFLMLAGVALHLMESHSHPHTHEILEHEHAHSHDPKQIDGHHLHTHDVLPKGTHSHLHRHDAMQHTHPHVPDAHHGHVH